MNCPRCAQRMRRVHVSVEGVRQKAASWQCPSCSYFAFEPVSARRVIDQLRSPLRIQQRIVKLSKDRLGLYLSKDIVRSLELKGGETVEISAPTKRQLVIEIG